MRISFSNCNNIVASSWNVIVYLRCCLAGEFAEIANKNYLGINCKKDSADLLVKQEMLKYLMTVNYNNLSYECLEVTELEVIANYILQHCEDCTRQLI